MAGRLNDQMNGPGKTHNKAGHGRVCQCYRTTPANLIPKDRDYRAPGTQHIAEAGRRKYWAVFTAVAVSGRHEPLAHQLAGTHNIGRVDGLVGAGKDYACHLVFNGPVDDVLDAEDVGLHGFERGSLAQDYMLKSRCVKYNVHMLHFAGNLIPVPNIRQKKADIVKIRKIILEKKKFTFVVVNPDQFANFIIVQQLLNQFFADGTAGTGYQHSFIIKEGFHDLGQIVGCMWLVVKKNYFEVYIPLLNDK